MIQTKDPNMIFFNEIGKNDCELIDVKSGKFSVFGLYDFFNRDDYVRMPPEIPGSVSEGLFNLNQNTSGGRVCFITDSDYIGVDVDLCTVFNGTNMSGGGRVGIDAYILLDGDTEYRLRCSFLPATNEDTSYKKVIDVPKGRKKVIMNLPLYAGIKRLKIGLQKNTLLEKFNPYKNMAPIVYYGSSITQGACATRPSNSYESMISRRNFVNFINLGFSGACRGEKPMVDYIASLDMSLFVLDFDHNADNPQQLRERHYNVYKAVRNAHPDIPIIMATKPDFENDDHNENPERLKIVRADYLRARREGDRNVYFIDGRSFYGKKERGLNFADACHPNDLGFYKMSRRFGAMIDRLLKKR